MQKWLKKTNEDIHVYYDSVGKITFSKTLPRHNRLCRTTQDYFENWFRLMLTWSPSARGGSKEKGRPECFQKLEDILKTKLVFILCMSTNQLLSYPVNESWTVEQLQVLLAQETKIPIGEQDLLMASGIPPNPKEPATQCWAEMGEEEWLVFLFRKHSTSALTGKHKKQLPIPDRVQQMLTDPNAVQTFQDQKRTWAQAVFFCSEVTQEFKRLVQGQRALLLSTLRNHASFSQKSKAIHTHTNKLAAKIEYFQQSQAIDIQKYEEQQTQGFSSQKLYNSWMKMSDSVNRMGQLITEATLLEQHCAGLSVKVVEMERSPFGRPKQVDILSNIESQAVAFYENLRQASRDHKGATLDNKSMTSTIYKCCQQREKLIPDLYQHLSKINEFKTELLDLMPQLDDMLAKISNAEETISAHQRQRQRDMWRIVKTVMARRTVSIPKEEEPPMLDLTPKINPGRENALQSSLFFEKSSEQSMVIMAENRESVDKLQRMMQDMQREITGSRSSKEQDVGLHNTGMNLKTGKS